MRGFAYVMVFLAIGCGSDDPAVPDADPLGMDCSAGQNCGPNSCVEGICTTACESTDDCRSGTECRSVDGVLSCVQKRWLGGQGQFGTGCTTGDCADDFECIQRAGADIDPYAYCTTSCTEDRDCPPQYTCSDDTCIRKTTCSPCALDEECVTDEVPDGMCADDGSGVMACSKSCDPKGETCTPGFECVGTGAAAHCQHLTGSCTGEGATCDPCQVDADCAGSGGFCHRQYFSGETYCVEPCGAGNTCDSPFFCASITGEGTGCIPPNEDDNSCEPYLSSM